jgi:hypothetical protein
MAHQGRIEGRVSGDAYELVQGGEVKQSIPLAQAHADERLKRTILRNKWEPLP